MNRPVFSVSPCSLSFDIRPSPWLARDHVIGTRAAGEVQTVPGAKTMTDTRLIYIHDPMCSWCWGFRPTLEALLQRLPDGLGFERLLGGLAPDSNVPMGAEMRAHLQQTWHRIQERIPGTRFNFDFWTACEPRRSTWPACRAVVAARRCDPDSEDAMIRAIQQAYYLQARNPSDRETLLALAGEIGLNRAAFEGYLDNPETAATFEQEMQRAHRMGADSFPSLRLQIGESVWPVAVNYTDADAMLGEIQTLLAG